MEMDAILDQVKQAAGLFEAYHVTTIKGFRRDNQGTERPITVEIWDAGAAPEPSRRDARYFVQAHDDRGRSAGGNSAATVEAAIAKVHWGNLDRGAPSG